MLLSRRSVRACGCVCVRVRLQISLVGEARRVQGCAKHGSCTRLCSHPLLTTLPRLPSQAHGVCVCRDSKEEAGRRQAVELYKTLQGVVQQEHGFQNDQTAMVLRMVADSLDSVGQHGMPCCGVCQCVCLSASCSACLSLVSPRLQSQRENQVGRKLQQ